MMKRISFLLYLLCLAVSLCAAPYDYFFKHYQTRDGMPSNTVYCAAQDRYGYIWIGTDDGICWYDGYHFTSVGNQDFEGLMRGMSTALCVDADGLVWFSTVAGCGYYDPATGESRLIGILEPIPVSKIVVDADDCVWFQGQHLHKYDKSASLMTTYQLGDDPQVTSLTVDSYGTVWCVSATTGDLFRYENRADRFRRETAGDVRLVEGVSKGRFLAVDNSGQVLLLDPENIRSERLFNYVDSGVRMVNCLMERRPGEFWIGTDAGILIYVEGEGLTNHITRSERDPMSLSSNFITSLFADAEENVWIGSFYWGLDFWQNNRGMYQVYYPNGTPGSMEGRIVRTIAPGADGTIWMGTEDGGLNRFNPETGSFDRFQMSGVTNNIQDIMVLGDELWISTFGDGLFRYDPARRRVIARITFPDNRMTRLLQTSDGSILAGTRAGLYRLAPGATRFEQIEEIGQEPVMSLAQDSSGRIWVGTESVGIWLLNVDFEPLDHLEANRAIPGSGRITSLFEDGWGRMWIATSGVGILVADALSDEIRFQNITRADGLPTNNVCSVIEDDSGMIWAATTKGLVMLHPDHFLVTPFFENTQMAGNLYSYGASYVAPDGTVYLGMTDGVFAFQPDAVHDRRAKHELNINGIVALAGDRLKRLTSPGASALTSDRIKVSYRDITVLTISFSAPNYSNVLATRYLCTFTSRGTGVITSVTSENYVQYANLSYGKNTFTVSVYGSVDPKDTRTLEIIVTPPFMRSAAAAVLGGLLLACVVALVMYFVYRWRRNQRETQLAKLEQLRQREMYEAKNNFFTNITHEIRTPLTLIKMPMDKIIRSKKLPPAIEKEMLLIQSNTDRLLALTNQLLDLKKLENGDEKLVFTRQNICDTVQKACERFSTVAAEQEISLNVSVPDGIINMMYARDSVEKIVTNLISNAIKYGSGIINVILERASDDKVVLRVDSNGPLIPVYDRDKIFEKFYQGGKGTGLGLPLARTLAESHGGRLYLDTERTDCNSFVLELPVEHPEQIVVVPTDPVEQEETGGEQREFVGSRSSLLIVEDNEDFRRYLGSEFSEEYNVFLAANGKIALEILENQRIDLVISDIMMPVMDGCELCNKIKTNPEYSHIPVLLLTAAVGIETRIETLQVGADGYIEKPFPIELLRANISNLFKNKEIAYRQFTSSPLSHFSSAASKVDEAFMERLHKTIMDNLTDNNLTLEELASLMNTSSSTLYRKVKANTGMNVNEYLRLCRLKKAAELLSSQQYRINEVADMLGFSSSSYFAASFQKQFSVSPSAFVKGLKR